MHSFRGYSQSLGLVSASFCDRYDMMLSSALALLILSQHSLRQNYSNSAQHIGPSTFIVVEMRHHRHHYISGWERPREWPLNVKPTPEPPSSSCFSSSQTPTQPSSPPLHEHLIRLFFWSGPPLSASPPISSEAPVFFLHRGAELECRAPPLWQCSWLIPEQSDSWETLNELPS